MLKNITNSIRRIEKEREDLINLILGLPDNPTIKRLGEKGNCFTIQFSQLENTIMSPEYYDFKHQYRRIAEILNEKAIRLQNQI